MIKDIKPKCQPPFTHGSVAPNYTRLDPFHILPLWAICSGSSAARNSNLMLLPLFIVSSHESDILCCSQEVLIGIKLICFDNELIVQHEKLVMSIAPVLNDGVYSCL